MRSPADTEQPRARRASSRGHVRPRDEAPDDSRSGRARRRRNARRGVQPEPKPAEGELKRIPRRMRPRSQARVATEAEKPLNLTQRRALRRARKERVQAQARGERRSRPIQLLSWRLVSGAMVIGLGLVLYLFLTMDAFVIYSVQIGGEKYLAPGEIFRLSDIAKQRIFRVDAADIEAQLEDVPNIADAEVLVGWPPDMVQIIVREREPALIWEQGVRVWVDTNGIVMKLREDRTDLLMITVPDEMEPLSAGSRIPQSIVDGALLMKKRHPNINVLLYDTEKGLGHYHNMGWTVWFGDGKDMDAKLLVYNRLVEEIVDKMQPGEIDMRDPDHPVIDVLWYIE